MNAPRSGARGPRGSYSSHRSYWSALAAAGFLLLTSASATAQNRAHFGRVELLGPLADVELDLGRAGRTRIEGRLLAGEARTLSVPLPARSAAERAPPTIRTDAGRAGADLDPNARGRARFLGWSLDPRAHAGGAGGAGDPAGLETLAPALRARPRPAVADARPAPRGATPWFLAAWIVLALALRRRPWTLAGLALVAGAATRLLVRAPDDGRASRVEVLDGDVGAERWSRIVVAAGALDVDVRAYADESRAEANGGVPRFELAVDPPEAALTWRIPLAPGVPWRAEARGARLFLSDVFEAGPERLTAEVNRYGNLDEVWLRADGAWLALPPWDEGAPLPAARGAGVPPGWLAAGLPQGVRVLVARRRAPAGERPSWIRFSGL